ncbi:MIT (microtubule interacting and transport) domain [Rhizoctonia solani]|uniref:MIT (Microtubule interacting and transport) domain n=1 Tax=Rhizoctonia solani TaxID=456999 RepID=A0A8H8P550_9AGAM|nr:MIT (microtubule interacting and transport) domain [Rhizoctonia solani]QRW25355.1 MIT (microtubule interacting and transport) domain [Rhizoctonia solani]
MSKPSLSETKLLDDAQNAQRILFHLATNSTRPQIRNAARTAGSRALGRADLIKNAKQGAEKSAARSTLEEEQLHILKRSSRVNGINLPAWPSSIGQSFGSDDQSRSIFIDTDGAPQLSPAHSAALAGWNAPWPNYLWSTLKPPMKSCKMSYPIAR